ncbi:MAG: sterol desaturase [Spirochaetaceae bacterium]|nr:sterol desaturase [Spirochaetaceae bacterium]
MEALSCELSWDCVGQVARFQFFMNFVRYYPVAGLLFLVVWVWGKRRYIGSRIQQKWPDSGKIWHEIRWSFVTLLVFSSIAIASITMGKAGWNQVYLDFSEFGMGYAVFSLVAVTIWHETWFYWMHRLVHKKPWFKLVHLTHHRSTNPSPFAAYAFNGYEAFLEAIYLPLFTFIVPIHPAVILVHIGYAMIMNIWWHSGYEVFPAGWTRGRITQWINTSTHHNMHHSHFNGNFSLYFNFWDRICGTNFPNYDEYFEGVVARRRASKLARPAAGMEAMQRPAA